MLGRAVSSSTPIDFQPRSTMGFSDSPLMNCHAFSPGPTQGCPYCAVGMQSALDSAISLPSSSTKASRMLVFVTPPDVSRSFKMPPDLVAIYRCLRRIDQAPPRDSSQQNETLQNGAKL